MLKHLRDDLLSLPRVHTNALLHVLPDRVGAHVLVLHVDAKHRATLCDVDCAVQTWHEVTKVLGHVYGLVKVKVVGADLQRGEAEGNGQCRGGGCAGTQAILAGGGGGGSRGHSKDWTVTLENGPSPSALRGAVATVRGGLASAFKPHLRLRQGPRGLDKQGEGVILGDCYRGGNMGFEGTEGDHFRGYM